MALEPNSSRSEEPLSVPVDVESHAESTDEQPLTLRQPFALVGSMTFLGFVMLWLAFSPWRLHWLAFVAPAPWVWIVLDRRTIGPVTWIGIWFTGSVYWLGLSLWGSRLDMSAWFAGAPLAGLLSGLFVGFLCISRMLRKRYYLPAWIACPVVWIAIEELRSECFGGMSLGSLGHAVVRIEWLTQLSSLGGTVLVSGFVIAVSASATQVVWGLRKYSSLTKLRREFEGNEIVDASGVVPLSDRIKPTINLRDSVVIRPDHAVSHSRSMQKVVERVHHKARTDDIRAPLFSAVMLILLLALTYLYGNQRIRETAQWKLFEGNQFQILAVQPSDSPDALQNWVTGQNLPGVSLVATVESPDSTRLAVMDPPSSGDATLAAAQAYLVYKPSAEADDSAGELIYARRDTENVEPKSLPFQTPEPRSLDWLVGRPVAFQFLQRDDAVPIQLAALSGNLMTIEEDQSAFLRSLSTAGAQVDTILWYANRQTVAMRLWPNLIARAAISSAAANRCSLVIFMPDAKSFVVSCGSRRIGMDYQQAFADRSVASLLIDPRTSQLHGSGHLIGPAVIGIVLCMVLGNWLTWIRKPREEDVPDAGPARTQVMTTGNAGNTPSKSLLGVPPKR